MKPGVRLKRRYRSFQIQRYLRTRGVFQYIPYPLDIYDQLLRRLKTTDGNEILPFLSYRSSRGEVNNFFVRHDIDTKDCIKNLPSTLAIDENLNVQSGVYLRADDEEYCLSEYRTMIQRNRSLGFEIGLHSLCYLKDDYLGEFRKETEKFREEMGFQPRSFTVHGLGTFRLDVRNKFYREIAVSFRKFGYETGDIPQLRAYEYVVQDCHLDSENRRFLYDDVLNWPPLLLRGSHYLILTHPCYWNEERDTKARNLNQ
jgi:hypothetical protein